MARFLSRFKANFGKFRQFPTRFDAKMRAADEQEKGEIRFTVSGSLFAYLGWLVRNTVLGRTENDVARQILTQRLSEMRQEDFRDGQRP
jgi:hypothetical protein